MPNPVGRPPKYPFATLAEGERFFVMPGLGPAGGLLSLQALARYHSRARQTRFVVVPWVMKSGKEGFRVTRLPR